MGSVKATSPRRTISISTSEVKTLVIEPISKTVLPSRGRLSSLARLPYETIRRPFESMIPTTIAMPRFSAPTRSVRILRISESAGG
jgi:hypothetical protein